MVEIRPRETVILAADFAALTHWYRDLLGFRVTQLFTGEMHYANLETDSGIKIGIAPAAEVGITLQARVHNAVVLQIEVDDLPAFFSILGKQEVTIVHGPSFNQEDGFWFGTIADPEGNQIWVVDKNCP
jgi:predicted enzyme related to lactoylglutathione lyase